jgi:L-iditol 2-dehydrogenase
VLPGEVLVRSHAFSICGSDVELVTGVGGHPFVRYPVIPGHEWSGTVAEVRSVDAGLSVGDEVIVVGIAGCGHCRSCLAATPALCREGYQELGFTRPGGAAEWVSVAAAQVHRLPPEVPLSAAPIVEPAAVAMRALQAAAFKAGERIAVIGTGALGLLVIELARAMGAAGTVAIARSDAKLQRALGFGADEAISTALLSDHKSLGDVDVIVEAAGTSEAVELALAIASPASRVVLTGVAGSEATINVASDLVVLKALRVIGVAGASVESWRAVLELVGPARIDLDRYVTDRFPLSAAAAAFERAASGGAEVIRVVVEHDLGR